MLNAAPHDADDLKQLAPTGKLRGGVVVAPAGSAFFAIKDGKGEVSGVTVDLLRAFAQKLNCRSICRSMTIPARSPTR